MKGVVGGGHSGVVASMFTRPAYKPAAHPVARIHLFGSMRATSYLGDDILPRRKKTRAFLGYLCLSFGARVPRNRLASLLWDKSSDELARVSFRQALSELTGAMGPLAAELISARRGTIRFNTDACWVDALALLEPTAPDEWRGDLARVCTGMLFEDLDGLSEPFDRWLSQHRTRADELRASLEPHRTPSKPHRAAGLAPTDTYRHQPLPGRNRLRVAVLPFEGKGTDREETLASSLSHEIGAALARFRWFDVINPIQAHWRPAAAVTEDLFRKQLDYAVDGVVSRHGRLLEIKVRLLDLTRATQPIWNERFELAADELHRLHEMVTPRVVASIDPAILFIEGQPRRREHYGATGLLLLAIPLIYSMERTKFERAGDLIKEALGIDPQNAMALAWSAIWHITRCGHGWTQDIAATLAQAEAESLKAIDLDPNNAEALGIYAHTCAWKKSFDDAIKHFDQSLRLNPNLAFVWWLSAATYCYIGDANEALKRLNRYHELAPFDPYSTFHQTVYIIAYTLKGDYEQAVLVGRAVVKANPDFSASYKPLIAALGHLGRADEAKPYIEKLLSLEPTFTVRRFGQVYPLKLASDRKRYMEGLRLAGVPEGD